MQRDLTLLPPGAINLPEAIGEIKPNCPQGFPACVHFHEIRTETLWIMLKMIKHNVAWQIQGHVKLL